ncbi:TPA: PerC family transcriptional regulator [Enterobacter hormaechei]|uniref:PerC family transcriptional regulator n=1 Tax=Enterobacter cloacae complex TaxID=354276 RepID=UPI0018EB9E5D|nr:MULTISPECIES: PerC family transcriptional regulator [Enterobacter cloacae complex]MBT2044120.1 PerC family transcriptional regulator [Enterobacter hormaechei subsp. xiangfangensis]MBJ6373838.1 PerC family transcriptional regulator [Enterobacter hormaechei]MBT2093687.1 PerC family transcriptional regulator [Enterobacter hormaechei subsp. xiangfangensis]MCE1262229.1 PerC family transcriptional regulator [Enterobacter kobei]MCE1361729.1 PerC family transcriptional regulator [Enterobacter kobei
MTKALTQKEQVAVFVRYQPNCAVADVSEALDMAGGTAGRLLRELSDEGVIIRSRDSVQYTYRAVPHADIPDVIIPCMVEKSDPVRMQAAEQKAKALEDKGLWRRAAAVYSEMFGIAGSAVEVARIDKRRKDCLRQAGRA